MKNVVKEIAKEATVESFTFWNHYQPKMPKSLMEKAIDENKKEN
jgi:cyclic lactone autoinducer peptide